MRTTRRCDHGYVHAFMHMHVRNKEDITGELAYHCGCAAFYITLVLRIVIIGTLRIYMYYVVADHL